MKRLYEQIEKIRRLTKDIDGGSTELIFTDKKILTILLRYTKEFCKRSQCDPTIVLLKAPPRTDCGISYSWEEGFCKGDVVQFTLEAIDIAAMQPWELEEGYAGDAVGESYVITNGFELQYGAADNVMSFFMPKDFYSFKGLMFDYKWVDNKSFDFVEDELTGFWNDRGTICDFFTMYSEERKKAFMAYKIPYTYVSDGTEKAEQIGEEFIDGVFYAFYIRVPEVGKASYDYVCMFDWEEDTYDAQSFYEDVSEPEEEYTFYCAFDWEEDEAPGSVTQGMDESGDYSVCFDWEKSSAYLGSHDGTFFEFHNWKIYGYRMHEFKAFQSWELADNFEGEESFMKGNLLWEQEMPVKDTFVKYIEYITASRLLTAETEKFNEVLAAHYKARYEMGIQLVDSIMKKGYEQRERSFGQLGERVGPRPARPRLPSHYPRVL